MNEGKQLSENEEIVYFLDTHGEEREKILAQMKKADRWKCPNCKQKNYSVINECRRCAQKTKIKEHKMEAKRC